MKMEQPIESVLPLTQTAEDVNAITYLSQFTAHFSAAQSAASINNALMHASVPYIYIKQNLRSTSVGVNYR